MAFDPLDWYCQPVENGVWTRTVQNAFGAYTPCAVDSLVIGISHLVILGLCIYRIWLIQKDFRVKRFRLRSNVYNYVLGIFAAYCVAEPLYRLIMGVSVLNLDGQSQLAPFEITSLIIEALAWCSMLVLLGIETKVYIYEFRWFVRFGLIYAAVGGAVLFNFIISVQELYSRFGHITFVMLCGLLAIMVMIIFLLLYCLV